MSELSLIIYNKDFEQISYNDFLLFMTGDLKKKLSNIFF